MKSNKNLKNKNISSQTEEKWLLKSARIASSKAIRSSIALGLTVKFIEDNSIVEVNPKGRIILRKKTSNKIDLSKLKKGMILIRK